MDKLEQKKNTFRKVAIQNMTEKYIFLKLGERKTESKIMVLQWMCYVTFRELSMLFSFKIFVVTEFLY